MAGTQNLEGEARRRAVDGVDEPVFYKGKQCWSIRRYSDLLLIVLLKAHRPKKFRGRYEASGPKRKLPLDPNRDYHAELQAKLATMRRRTAEVEACKRAEDGGRKAK